MGSDRVRILTEVAHRFRGKRPGYSGLTGPPPAGSENSKHGSEGLPVPGPDGPITQLRRKGPFG